MDLFRTYYYLTKPGLIYGNLLTVLGGYLYGAIQRPDFVTLAGVMAGSALVMASGTVLNNIQDRSMDQHMQRTKKRALVTGKVTPLQATIYSIVLGSLGLAVLAASTNALTVLLGAVGLISYAGIYTYSKPRTVHATLVGTIPGAVPILAGYMAATNRIDVSFAVLFALMFFWQMSHFYAIAVFRMKEYKAAKVPVISVTKGVYWTKTLMTIFGSGYLLSVVSLAHFGYAGMFYLAIMTPLALWWLAIIAGGLWTTESEAWARKVFFMSLLLLPALCATLALNAWVP
jgi:protoheme IX farnesyltransferase